MVVNDIFVNKLMCVWGTDYRRFEPVPIDRSQSIPNRLIQSVVAPGGAVARAPRPGTPGGPTVYLLFPLH